MLNNGIPLIGFFVAICQALNLNNDVFARRNNKGLTVDHFCCFLNKSVKIIAEDRDTNNIFVPVEVAPCYT